LDPTAAVTEFGEKERPLEATWMVGSEPAAEDVDAAAAVVVVEPGEALPY